jgi:hypothetical protein
MRMKYSVIASALVVALFTGTVTTRAEGPVAATVAAPQEPLVAHSLDLNTHAVNLIPQLGAPVGSVPKGPSINKVLILVAVLAAAYIVLRLTFPST